MFYFIYPRLAALIAIILLGVSLMSSVRAEDLEHHRPHSIQVSGQGRVSVAPDKAEITLSVEVQAKSAEAAREQAAAAMTALIKALKDENVADKDIQTRYVSLYPIYGQDGANKINGYQLANRVSVTIPDVNKVSTIIDSAVKAGGNPVRVQGINFAIANPEPALAQAREKAYADARAKAEQYAKLVGVTLGLAMHISEGTGLPPIPVPYAEMTVMRGAMGTGNPTPIQVGEQEVSITVNVIFGVE